MRILLVLASVLLLSVSAQLRASEGAYGGLGGGLLTFDDGFDEVEPKQLFGRLGYNFNDYVGIGFEGGFSLIEDEVFDIDFDVTTTFFYLRGSVPVGEKSSVYVLIGPTNVELTGSSGGTSLSADDSDTGTGFGFETQLETVSLLVDYIKYFDDDGVDVTSINLGVLWYF
ncbi:MAG: porin family protein [Gammaproteobacteria bacterium]|nr:porin family protein [Gammaproteobacteria bacterium]